MSNDSKDMDFCHSGETCLTNTEGNYWTLLQLDALKTVTKKVSHKAAEATGEFIWCKIANEIVKPKPVVDLSSRNVEEIIIPQEQREEILNELRQVL